jgi:MFS transporter, putative metabolite:H+ symporter
MVAKNQVSNTASSSLPGSARASLLVARIERLRISPWHVKARLVMGVATFFDAFDVLAIAYVLPVLAGLWKLRPQEIGLMISMGFVGQIAGAIFFGWLAERIGRIRAATYSMALFSVMSLICALSWNFTSLLAFRTIQGIGLGGEVPIAAAYINEISRAKGRGRFFLMYELIFPLGLVGASLLGFWLVPRLGWQVMFVIGGLPALLAIFVQRILPESPRWLLSKGRLDEAERVIERIETSVAKGGPLEAIELALTPVEPRGETSWRELFGGIYRRRTLVVWGLWICTYFVTYGVTTWLPTIYRTFYKLSIADALWNGVITNIAGVAGALLCALAVDRFGRRPWFIAAFVLGSAPLLTLWLTGAKTPAQVVVLVSVSFAFVTANSMLVYLYTPEIYPTRLRSLGTGAASAWLRIASAAGPSVVGFTLAGYGVPGAFLLFGLISAAGVAVALGVTETRERPLEEISP